MANISIKKDFEDGQKLFAQQLNNNFETIELGINAGNKLIWKDDNGAEFQPFRGNTEEIKNRPIIDGQELYNIENGDTFLDVGETRKVMNKPLWKDDNGAQVQSFRGTTAEVAARPIIDGQTLYNIETGETALDVGNKRISTGAGNVVYIGDEEPQNDATKIWIENDQVLNLGSEVAISAEEPTTQEKVWIQRGKNLFDKNNYGLFKGYMSSANINFVANNNGYLVYIPCMSNTDYIVTREILENNFQVGSGNIVPVNNGQVTQVVLAETFSRVTIKTGANDTYLYIYVKHDGDSSYALEQILDSLRVETPKKIHTKTDNGYEEFYNEINLENYSLGEQRIGTWIDGKPLYRKTIFREVAIEKDVPLVINSETKDIHRIVDIRGSISSSNKNAYRSINTYNLQDNKVSISMLIEQNGYIRIYSTDSWSNPDIVITFEYTKTTD